MTKKETEALELANEFLSAEQGGLYEAEDSEGYLRWYGMDEAVPKILRLAELVKELLE